MSTGSVDGTRGTFMKVVLDGLRLPTEGIPTLVDQVAHIELCDCRGNAKRVGDTPFDLLMPKVFWICG